MYSGQPNNLSPLNLTAIILIFISRKAGYCNHLRVFVCLFVSRISHKLLVGFWWNLVSREVMIIGRPSSKLGVIRIEIRIWDPDNCFSWTTGRILIVGKYSQSFSAVVVHTYIQLIPTRTFARVAEWYICESREMEIVGSISGDNREFFNFIFCYCSDPRDNYKISWSPGIQHRIFISGVSRLYHCCYTPTASTEKRSFINLCGRKDTKRISDLKYQRLGYDPGYRRVQGLSRDLRSPSAIF